MGDTAEPPNEEPLTEKSNERDELRTIAFRMREIHRMLAIRVEQENRRLEAEGLDPVTESGFLKKPDENE